MNNENPKQRLDKSERKAGRLKAIEHFGKIEDIWCKAYGDLVTLDIMKNDPELDFETARRCMEAVSFYLKQHLSMLDDEVQGCYRAVRRSWGYED